MPRFQPGQNRYFGGVARPTSSITSSILPLWRQPAQAGGLRRPMRPAKSNQYTIGKTERTDITKKLLKMPNYVPRATTKALKTFAKQVMAHQKNFSKEERAFAQATVHGDKVIKDQSAQKKFVEGEVAALVDIKDRRVKDTFQFTHHSAEVAGQTLRSLVKEHKEQDKPSVSERRSSISSRSNDEPTTTTAPIPHWTAPVQLDAGAGQTEADATSGWPAPFSPAHHNPVAADAVHAPTMPGLSTMSAGASADVLILSDRLSDMVVAQWGKTLSMHLRRLPLSTVPLIHAFPNIPNVIVIEAADASVVRTLKVPTMVEQVFIFTQQPGPAPVLPDSQTPITLVQNELTAESLQQVLGSQYNSEKRGQK